MSDTESSDKAPYAKRLREEPDFLNPPDCDDEKLVIEWKTAERKRRNGRAPYWPHVQTVINERKRKVQFRCRWGVDLSTANPPDYLKKHMIFTSEGMTCKGEQVVEV